MVDLFSYNNGTYTPKNPVPEDAATTLFRHDGTGYLAKGNITWDANGYGQVGGAGNNYAVK